ncbi:Disulfide bond formation protein D precursor [Aquimixticola soesokkakensis]|uniref:Disulfide bond formation protein D n=1 Tax=Aquimixticola soesokkakensis TaxID=1519096 RepID=A0A1Y5SN48_9RHOB|nr:DsbA family protein [Aquimixticola soesokkakensis]SLN44515.1 Disulfide bond formation protein D precursor [Aquimixticola soesokkakensis]
MTKKSAFAGAALALVASAFGFGVATLPEEAQAEVSLSELSDEDRALLRDEMRAYLLEEPEVIMEAVSILQSREEQAQVGNDAALVRTNADALFNDGWSLESGNPDGDVTVVEFMDYRCGYCRKAFPEVKALLEQDGNVRLIVKEFPVLGAESVYAARFALALQEIAGNGPYEAFHDAVMAMRGNVTPASLKAIATDLDLDVAAIEAGLESDQVNRILSENAALAQRMQINGTPGFIMGEQIVRGYVPLDTMADIVAQERAEG